MNNAGKSSRGRIDQISDDDPSERSFADEYCVAYATVRHAMALLREHEIIVTVHGRGACVKPSGSGNIRAESSDIPVPVGGSRGTPVARTARVTLFARWAGHPGADCGAVVATSRGFGAGHRVTV